MNKYKFIFTLFFIVVLTSLSIIPRAEVDQNEAEIELVTIGPGEFYWEAFGHSALRIKTNTSDYMYGFGYFNFSDEDFFIKFAKGEMQYFLGAEIAEFELGDYKKQGRKVWLQKLQLTFSQKNELINKLMFLIKPENRYYDYDYFLNNCTSKIRDILDEVTQGEISRQLKPLSTKISWNDLTFPANNQTWMNLGIALAYGLPAYSHRNQWQLSVFPEDFAKDLMRIKTKNNWNKPYQLYSDTINQQSGVEFNSYNFFKTHYAVLICVFILLFGVIIKMTRNLSIQFWLVLQSLLGVALLMLWFMTKHEVAAWNINTLLFFPFSFLLIFKSFNTSFVLNVFLLINISWLILAGVMTNYYLIGFCVINILIWKNFKTQIVTPKI